MGGPGSGIPLSSNDRWGGVSKRYMRIRGVKIKVSPIRLNRHHKFSEIKAPIMDGIYGSVTVKGLPCPLGPNWGQNKKIQIQTGDLYLVCRRANESVVVEKAWQHVLETGNIRVTRHGWVTFAV